MTDRERKINTHTVIEDSSSEEENIEEEPIPRLEPVSKDPIGSTLGAISVLS
jgi:hypothetical protein